MKRQLTAQQIEARDARRLKFKGLWKQVSAMSEIDRAMLAEKLGLVTCEGHALSFWNTVLVAMQLPNPSVLGGFRQWLSHGRAVMKGQHGAMIWCPCGGRAGNVPLDGGTSGDSTSAVADGSPEGDNDRRFIISTVFDISQTQEVETGRADVQTEDAPVVESELAIA